MGRGAGDGQASATPQCPQPGPFLFHRKGRGEIGLRPSIFLVNLYNKRVQSISSFPACFPRPRGQAGRQRHLQTQSGGVANAIPASQPQVFARSPGRSCLPYLAHLLCPGANTENQGPLSQARASPGGAFSRDTEVPRLLCQRCSDGEPHLCVGWAWGPHRLLAGHRSWRACWLTPCRGPLRCSGSLCSATGGSRPGLSHPCWQGAGGSAPRTCRQGNASEPSPGAHGQETPTPRHRRWCPQPRQDPPTSVISPRILQPPPSFPKTPLFPAFSLSPSPWTLSRDGERTGSSK